MNKKKYIFILVPIFFLLLFGDEIWISWRFHQLCKDAGVHVYEQVEVEGFYNDVMRSGYELVDKHGYQFMEHRSSDKGKIDHIQKVDGKWIKTTLDKPQARYHYQYSANNEDMGLQLEKWEVVVTDSNSDEILGRDTRYKKYPGWLYGLWKRLWGARPIICEGVAPTPPKLRHLLYHYVLVPEKISKER